MAWTPGREMRIEISGAALEAAVWGPAPGEAPTILLLHEGLGCVALWRDFPQALAEATGCGVAAWSRAGYGRSAPAALPRPVDYMTREAALAPAVMDALGLGRTILLGHSDGATIAAECAGGCQDRRLRGLILMAPHFFTEPMGLAEIARARAAYDEGDLRPRLAKYHDDVDNAFRGWNDAWLNPDFADWNVADCIDYLRIPALVIQGEDDPYGSAAQVEEVVARSYAPVDTLLIPGCGHAPQQEAREAVLAEVAEFSARLWRLEDEAVPLS